MLTPVHMGDFDDYRQLFGPMDAARRPQCALVSSSAERQQVLSPLYLPLISPMSPL